jgi:hypothetical protein
MWFWHYQQGLQRRQIPVKNIETIDQIEKLAADLAAAETIEALASGRQRDPAGNRFQAPAVCTGDF